MHLQSVSLTIQINILFLNNFPSFCLYKLSAFFGLKKQVWVSLLASILSNN